MIELLFSLAISLIVWPRTEISGAFWGWELAILVIHGLINFKEAEPIDG